MENQQMISMALVGIAAGFMAKSIAKLDVEASFGIAIGVVGIMFFIKTLSPPPAKEEKHGKKHGKKPAAYTSDSEEDEAPRKAKKHAKKPKKAAKPVASDSEPEAASAPEPVSEPEPAPVADKKKKKKAKKAKEPESEPEPEPAPTPAPLSKKAAKKAKQAAAAAATPAPAPVAEKPVEAEPEKLSKKARKQKKKQAEAPAPVAAIAEAPVEDDGWTTVPQSRPQRLDEQARFGDAHTIKEELNIPVDQHAIIMGKAGANLAALEKGTNTMITLPAFDKRSGTAASKWILVRGSPENVARAKKGIHDLVAKGFCKYTHPDQTDGYVTVPVEKRSFVIGQKGAFIDALKNATGCKITMPDRKSEETEVKLFGERAQVKMAKQYIKELLEEGFCEVTHPGWTKQEVDFPMHKIGKLMGKKAAKLRHMEQSTGCKITTPDRSDEEHGTVIIAGPEDSIIRARLLVLEAAQDDPEDIIIDEVDPDWAIAPNPSYYEW